MNIFRRPDYRSDTTQFLDHLKTVKPELQAQQRQGRSLLWDKHVDRDLQKDFAAGELAQKPYVYQNES